MNEQQGSARTPQRRALDDSFWLASLLAAMLMFDWRHAT